MNPHRALVLRNPIQTYAWGSRTAIAELLGAAGPTPEPQAELWMGAHPKAPSRVDTGTGAQPLDRLIRDDPEAILGPGAARRFGASLPFLFKVLAVAEPLSIQAHPDRAQAAEGFARENRAGLPIDAPQRNYRDPNHKPELICALSEFWALDGFRPAAAIRLAVAALCPESLKTLVDGLDGRPEDGAIRDFFQGLMGLDERRRRAASAEAAVRAARGATDRAVCRWVLRLAERYPGDVGVLAPAVLNLICLQPGEALFLPAGRLHAYLEGTGVEIMANSDNVLRGGLTPKHMDVAELLRVLRFEGRPAEVLRPVPAGLSGARYATPAEEFELWVLRVDPGRPWQGPDRGGVEILLCTRGEGRVRVQNGQETGFARGVALLVPAAAGPYSVTGQAVVYRAALPEGSPPRTHTDDHRQKN
jgi:mannose-6-phosphate isomerase